MRHRRAGCGACRSFRSGKVFKVQSRDCPRLHRRSSDSNRLPCRSGTACARCRGGRVGKIATGMIAGKAGAAGIGAQLRRCGDSCSVWLRAAPRVPEERCSCRGAARRATERGYGHDGGRRWRPEIMRCGRTRPSNGASVPPLHPPPARSHGGRPLRRSRDRPAIHWRR